MDCEKVKVKGRKIPETISEEELIEIVNYTTNNKHKLAFLLGFYQCMRVSEVTNLRPENIDKKQKVIHIKQSKGSKDRDIPFMKPLKLGERTVEYALNRLPIGVGIRALQLSFKQKAKDILNKDLHFHTLRHSGATWLLNKRRWDIRQVQRFLGHSKIQTTEIYTHVNAEDLRELLWEIE